MLLRPESGENMQKKLLSEPKKPSPKRRTKKFGPNKVHCMHIILVDFDSKEWRENRSMFFFLFARVLFVGWCDRRAYTILFHLIKCEYTHQNVFYKYKKRRRRHFSVSLTCNNLDTRASREHTLLIPSVQQQNVNQLTRCERVSEWAW